MSQARREKDEIIKGLLEQEVYTPGSLVYEEVREGLAKMSLNALRNLELILIFRSQERIELDRRVQEIIKK